MIPSRYKANGWMTAVLISKLYRETELYIQIMIDNILRSDDKMKKIPSNASD